MSRKKQPADKLTAHAVILTNCTKESGGLCNFDAFVTVPEFPHSACFWGDKAQGHFKCRISSMANSPFKERACEAYGTKDSAPAPAVISQKMHCCPTFWASAYIDIPTFFQNLRSRCICRKTWDILLPALHGEENMKISLLKAIVQKSVIADFSETLWKYMHEKPADEFAVFQSHLFSPVIITAIMVPEGGMGIWHADDSSVGNGDAMGISSQIVNGISKAVEGFLYERTPVGSVEHIDKIGP